MAIAKTAYKANDFYDFFVVEIISFFNYKEFFI